ncbi:MAG: hypothetical protein MJ093_00965 [Saccharofermentans sp.]|nr:hypothetical protein [Saccharofermentans sp.]
MSNNDNKQWFQQNDNRNPSKAPASKATSKKNNKNKKHNKAVGNKPVNKPSNKPMSQMPAMQNSGVQKPGMQKSNVQNSVAKKPTNVKPSEHPVKKEVVATKKKKKSFFKRKKFVKKDKKQDLSKVNNVAATAVAPVQKTPVVAPVDSKTKARQKKTKIKGLKLALGSIVIVCAAVGVMIFAVHHLLDYFAVKPEMAFIENGSVEHTIGARALIVRSETLISTSATGDLVTQTTEGSRVYKGQNVALVVPEDMQSVVANLRNTQSQISEVQQELIAEGSAPGADAIYEEINGSLVPIVDMIRLDAMDGNVSDMASYMSSISVLLNQRESELSGLEFDDERLRVLRADEIGYENQLQKSSSTIVTNKPGIISFKLDGLETELSFNVLLEADPGEIKNYINSATGLITSDLYIEPGESVARIASNEEQYIAVFLKEKDASVSAFQVGTLHTLNVRSEGISIGKCKVERCVSTDDGMLIIFSTTHYVEDLLDLRTADIEIVITETTGLRIPVESLVDPDYSRGVATIYVNNQGFADEVGVIIEDYDREFAIVSPIGDNHVPNTQTVLITNPESIKPGEKVDK